MVADKLYWKESQNIQSIHIKGIYVLPISIYIKGNYALPFCIYIQGNYALTFLYSTDLIGLITPLSVNGFIWSYHFSS